MSELTGNNNTNEDLGWGEDFFIPFDTFTEWLGGVNLNDEYDNYEDLIKEYDEFE